MYIPRTGYAAREGGQRRAATLSVRAAGTLRHGHVFDNLEPTTARNPARVMDCGGKRSATPLSPATAICHTRPTRRFVLVLESL
ncbi:MAG: hypothetical protein P4N60_17620 [Verrucomicrobiae bacterium]|nr:hypothetical protein [Verrucomicrobiae bacterium]